MSSADAIYLSQLLMTKVSHDLAGMAGSVLNGIELFEETNDAESVALSKDSAKAFIARVKFYRAVLGLDGAFVNASEVKALTDAFLQTYRKITLDFKIKEVDVKTLRLAMLLAMIVTDAFTKGGVITMDNADGNLSVVAQGENINFTEETGQAMEGELSELSAKYAPALLCSFLLKFYKKKLTIDASRHVVAFKIA